MKEIVWVVKFRNGKPFKAFSHCKLYKTGGIGREQVSFKGRLRWVEDKECKFYNQDQFCRESILLKDEVITSQTEDWEEFMGNNIALFMEW